MPDSALATLTLHDLLQQTAAKTPTPGGGAIAATVGALAAALAQMVVSYSVGKKSLAPHEPALQDAVRFLENARALALRLADEDAQAYAVLNDLWKLPEDDPRRLKQMPAALHEAAQVPLALMASGVDLLRRFESLAPITNRQLRSDLGIAAILADATVRSSAWNVRINAASIADPAERAVLLKQCDDLIAASGKRCAAVETACAV